MRTICFGLLVALISLGCSSTKPIACSTMGSRLTDGPDDIPLATACTYAVAKHGGAACPAWDITIGMTGYTVPQAQPHQLGLVYTVSSLTYFGEFTMDSSQLCTGPGYFTMTGDWSPRGGTATNSAWPAPDEPDGAPLPGFQEILVHLADLAGVDSYGGIDLTLSAD